ncbi:MAG: hypothetical protein JSU69_10470 [Candidatus Zixiibacteriota bacterium]|nr:MAG: hypothetical protein JSU69_10470 [candidate division Zixibacteria bacterium]
MPFCPKCRYEYKIGIAVCPDCDEKLVDSIPDDADNEHPEYENWIPIARLTSPQFSEMLLEVLRARDIPAVIQSQRGHFGKTGQMGLHSFMSAGAGYILLVPGEFVVEADREAEVMLGDDWRKARLFDIENE